MKIYNKKDIIDHSGFYPPPNILPLVTSSMQLMYGEVIIVNDIAYKILYITYPLRFDICPMDLEWGVAEELPTSYQQIWTHDVLVTALKYTTYVTCPYCGAVDTNRKKVQNHNYYCGYCSSDYSYKRIKRKYYCIPQRKSIAIKFQLSDTDGFGIIQNFIAG